MTVPLIIGKKGAERAGKALTGDIYTRTWTRTHGKGKDKHEVEHTLHANPVALALGAILAGGTLALGALGLALSQRKVSRTDGKDLIVVLDLMDATTKTITVVDVPAIEGYWTNIKYTQVWVPPVPAVTHEETVVTKEGYLLVKSKSGVPYKKLPSEDFIYPDRALTQKQKSAGFRFAEVLKSEYIANGKRYWYRYHSDEKSTYGIGEREGFTIDIGL